MRRALGGRCPWRPRGLDDIAVAAAESESVEQRRSSLGRCGVTRDGHQRHRPRHERHDVAALGAAGDEVLVDLDDRDGLAAAVARDATCGVP
jgi:hypothetical protein